VVEQNQSQGLTSSAQLFFNHAPGSPWAPYETAGEDQQHAQQLVLPSLPDPPTRSVLPPLDLNSKPVTSSIQQQAVGLLSSLQHPQPFSCPHSNLCPNPFSPSELSLNSNLNLNLDPQQAAAAAAAVAVAKAALSMKDAMGARGALGVREAIEACNDQGQQQHAAALLHNINTDTPFSSLLTSNPTPSQPPQQPLPSPSPSPQQLEPQHAAWCLNPNPYHADQALNPTSPAYPIMSSSPQWQYRANPSTLAFCPSQPLHHHPFSSQGGGGEATVVPATSSSAQGRNNNVLQPGLLDGASTSSQQQQGATLPSDRPISHAKKVLDIDMLGGLGTHWVPSANPVTSSLTRSPRAALYPPSNHKRRGSSRYGGHIVDAKRSTRQHSSSSWLASLMKKDGSGTQGLVNGIAMTVSTLYIIGMEPSCVTTMCRILPREAKVRHVFSRPGSFELKDGVGMADLMSSPALDR
jgi:hypothetical protein